MYVENGWLRKTNHQASDAGTPQEIGLPLPNFSSYEWKLWPATSDIDSHSNSELCRSANSPPPVSLLVENWRPSCSS